MYGILWLAQLFVDWIVGEVTLAMYGLLDTLVTIKKIGSGNNR